MINKEDKIDKIPLFSKGCLTFSNSKHALVKNGEYYRCALKTNGFCRDESEKLISTKSIENELNKLFEKFLILDGKGLPLFEKLMNIYIQGMLTGASRDIHLQDEFESTGNIIIGDLKAGKEIQKSDFLEFKRTYFQILKNFYGDMLIGYIIDTLFVLVKNKSEQDEMNSVLNKILKQPPRKLHRSFALQLKKVYISDDGKIENIEFEGFGWFIYQYFKKIIPEYRPKIKDGFILNSKKFNSLDCQETIKEFVENDLQDTYSYNAFATKYAKEKLIKKIFSGFEKLTTQEKIDYLIKLNSPSKEMMFAHISTLVRN